MIKEMKSPLFVKLKEALSDSNPNPSNFVIMGDQLGSIKDNHALLDQICQLNGHADYAAYKESLNLGGADMHQMPLHSVPKSYKVAAGSFLGEHALRLALLEKTDHALRELVIARLASDACNDFDVRTHLSSTLVFQEFDVTLDGITNFRGTEIPECETILTVFIEHRLDDMECALPKRSTSLVQSTIAYYLNHEGQYVAFYSGGVGTMCNSVLKAMKHLYIAYTKKRIPGHTVVPKLINAVKSDHHDAEIHHIADKVFVAEVGIFNGIVKVDPTERFQHRHMFRSLEMRVWDDQDPKNKPTYIKGQGGRLLYAHGEEQAEWSDIFTFSYNDWHLFGDSQLSIRTPSRDRIFIDSIPNYLSKRHTAVPGETKVELEDEPTTNAGRVKRLSKIRKQVNAKDVKASMKRLLNWG